MYSDNVSLSLNKKKLEAEQFARDHELQIERLRLEKEGRVVSDVGERGLNLSGGFDLASNLRLLPKFNEHDPDVFFSLFETMSEERNWPVSIRVVMLQTVITGKAQEAYAALTMEDRKDYNKVKGAILKAYELVPEAYRQRFRGWRKESYQISVGGGNEIIDEDVIVPGDGVLLPRLKNSETLQNLDALLLHLTPVQSKELIQLILEFPGLFSDVPTRTHLIQHDVDVGDAQPIRQRFYRAPLSKRKVLESEIQYMLENGIAVPSCSSWASPCLLVKKPDSTYRFCTDYRKLNAITKPDAFPLPRMEDCVDQVGTANFVSKIDLLKGYWQVPLTPRAREVTSFITPSGLYSYSVMSFGLRNAPATFQRLMNHVVFGLEGCAVYLDDVIVFSETWEQHLIRLRALLTRLVEACLTVNLAKCEFAKATVRYLGKEVGQGKVRPVLAKVLAIQQFPPPSTKKELMRFLGMVAAPKLDMPFKLQVDASQVGAGAVLLQTGADGLDYPISFFSRSRLLMAKWADWRELNKSCGAGGSQRISTEENRHVEEKIHRTVSMQL
ncbi:hypothetical protein QQF64_025829 [Cirrhinus molitorella]|uniref:ribonuclease H n=1 Tax=Cirrhinus molitorella TaxID=172907 RepID=A0ABR3NRB5_9TELE